jgi:hypothetical protein
VCTAVQSQDSEESERADCQGGEGHDGQHTGQYCDRYVDTHLRSPFARVVSYLNYIAIRYDSQGSARGPGRLPSGGRARRTTPWADDAQPEKAVAVAGFPQIPQPAGEQHGE